MQEMNKKKTEIISFSWYIKNYINRDTVPDWFSTKSQLV